MKMLMFTPVARTSAIGRMSGLVVDALGALDVETVVVRTEDRPLLDSARHDFACRIVRWDDIRTIESEAASADAIVYQVGNSFDFHCGAVEWMPALPGVVCLHDYFLGHLFWQWADTRRTHAADILRVWYGEDVANRYFSFESTEAFVEGTHQEAPMVEWIAAMADGVLTHSGWGIQRVLDACAGPVRITPLAYDAPSPGTAVTHRLHEETRAPFTVLTFGHINPNKRSATVIRAIGQSDLLRPRTTYHLVGRIEPGMERDLRSLAQSLGVTVAIAGEVDDGGLQQAIAGADVVCGIRLPALEAASAAAIESMLYGKPVLVMNVGFYRELPDDCVRKIDPGDETAALRLELESLFRYPRERLELGTRAARWASRTFTAARYAESLMNLCARVACARPALDASRRFATTLAGWGAPESAAANPLTLAPLSILSGGIADGRQRS